MRLKKRVEKKKKKKKEKGSGKRKKESGSHSLRSAGGKGVRTDPEVEVYPQRF